MSQSSKTIAWIHSFDSQAPPSQMNCRQCHFVCDEISENLQICPMEGCSQCTLCCICQNEELGNILNKDLYCKKCKAREGN